MISHVPHVSKLFTYAASLISSHHLMIHSPLLSPFVLENMGALTSKVTCPRLPKLLRKSRVEAHNPSTKTQSPGCQSLCHVVSVEPRVWCAAAQLVAGGDVVSGRRKGSFIAANLGSLFPVYCPIPPTPMNPIQFWEKLGTDSYTLNHKRKVLLPSVGEE